MHFDSGVTALDFSPDGRWLAYVSEESGRPEVYVRRYPDGAERAPVSIGGGSQPRWRRDMRELFYLAPGGKLMSASVRSGERLTIGPPQVLTELRAITSRQLIDRQQYTTTDGQRFLVNEPTGTERQGLTVVLNWTDALGKPK